MAKSETLKIAISACLLGEAVRYDGTSKSHDVIRQFIVPYIDVVPICPEVGAGLGVPRETIQLVKINEQIRVRNVLHPELDVTDSLTEYALKILSEHTDLRALIVKARSPSCGLVSTPILENGQIAEYGAGQFSHAIKTQRTDLLIVEENQLDNRNACEKFLGQLRNY